MPLQSELLLDMDRPEDWLDTQVRHMAEHDLLPAERAAGHALFETEFGAFRVQAEAGALRIRIDARDDQGIETLQSSIAEYIAAHDRHLTDRLVWRGHAPAAMARPGNFRQMTVVARRLVSPWMIRLTLSGTDLAPFAERGLHVRLLLPPKGRAAAATVWPRRLSSGVTQFPDGEDALTIRVYTLREVRADRGEVDIDIVRHAGGALADWAETAKPGAAIGMIGPGGGYLPEDGWLLIGGDETALPAIARILESRAPDGRGHAILSVRHPEARQPIAAPAGFSLDWRTDDPDGIADAIAGALADIAPTDLTPTEFGPLTAWFAGEASVAKRVRALFRAEPRLTPARTYAAAYWRRDTPPTP